MDSSMYKSSINNVTRSLSDCGLSATNVSEQDMVMKKGPWTEDEDTLLMNYVSVHGEGHWNSVARCSGLKRNGKSCRLRWLNYLRPNVRHGNITLQEQLLILDLHSRWGNRWSKIAEQLPGRTDNEIKNYWRTRVVKQAKQLKCDVNSKQFRDTLRFVWIPRLIERIQSSSATAIPNNNSYGQRQTATKAHSETCGTTNPLMLSEVSSYSSEVDVLLPHSLSESNVSFDLMDSAELGSTWQEWNCYDIQAFEQGNVFGGSELWTDENLYFLQQQLADL